FVAFYVSCGFDCELSAFPVLDPRPAVNQDGHACPSGTAQASEGCRARSSPASWHPWRGAESLPSRSSPSSLALSCPESPWSPCPVGSRSSATYFHSSMVPWHIYAPWIRLGQAESDQ